MKTKNLSLFLILILVFISLFIFLISCGGNKDSTTTAPPPGSWGTAGLIEGGTGNAYVPHVSMDASGNAIAVWYQDDGTRYNIYANRYVAGVGWGTAGLIETDDTGDARNPQISVDGSGNAIAVWYQNDGTRDNIRANRYVAGIGWGTAELIETDNTGDARNPQISVDGSGNAIAVWYQNDGTRWNILANRFNRILL